MAQPQHKGLGICTLLLRDALGHTLSQTIDDDSLCMKADSVMPFTISLRPEEVRIRFHSDWIRFHGEQCPKNGQHAAIIRRSGFLPQKPLEIHIFPRTWMPPATVDGVLCSLMPVESLGGCVSDGVGGDGDKR